MESINISGARQHLYALAEQTVRDSTPIRITYKKGDVVLMSAADFAAWEETVYLMSIPGMKDDLCAMMNAPDDEFIAESAFDWDV